MFAVRPRFLVPQTQLLGTVEKKHLSLPPLEALVACRETTNLVLSDSKAIRPVPQYLCPSLRSARPRVDTIKASPEQRVVYNRSKGFLYLVDLNEI